MSVACCACSGIARVMEDVMHHMSCLQGSKSVEVRPVGVSKGASMERILQYMAGEALLRSSFFFFGDLIHKGASMERILQYMAGGWHCNHIHLP